MVSEDAFSRKSLPPGENKLAVDKAESDDLILVSSAEINTSDRKFDDLLKAEFIKLVRGMGRPR